MKNQIKSILVLVCICSVTALLLALTNSFTAPIIEESQKAQANAALLEVMPGGSGFEEMDISSYTLPATVRKAYKEASGGYVLELETAGYGSGMKLMCGVSADGKITGAVCLSSNETLGHEKTFGANFKDKDAEGVAAVDVISGATKTTAAYRSAMTDALNSAVILGGGSVDIRTEEEILRDNLSAALGAGEGKFTKLFLTAELDGVSAVYEADNGSGKVLVIGESYIGIGADGKALGGVDAELGAKAEAAAARLAGVTLEDVDVSSLEGLPQNFISAKKTSEGGFVIETKGAGYGIIGDDHGGYVQLSGEYIHIKIAISPEGRIIDVITVKHAETGNIGGENVCDNPGYYGQYVSKTEDNYTEVDAVAGATNSSDGYKAAVRDAFASYKIVKGGQK